MDKTYRLYIDESGDPDYGKRILKKLNIKVGGVVASSIDINEYPELNKSDKRYLGLTGCIIETDEYDRSFVPEVDAIKRKHFLSNQVILHRKEIINKEGSFWRLRDPQKEQEFNTDILTFLKDQNYTIITVVLDKLSHILHYGKFAYHPYHYCLDVILERYCGFLRFYNSKGDIITESRGGTEDRKLKEVYQKFYNNGNQFQKPEFYQTFLTTKEIKIKPKAANIAGVQIADLIAFPSKQRILIENSRVPEPDRNIFGGKVCEAIKNKYNNNYGKTKGYGKVFLK